jgi:hypothetical protein
MEAHWIWNPQTRQGVILENHSDATYAATGKSLTLDISPIAMVFRKDVLDDDVLTIQTIDMPEVIKPEE